MVNHFWECWKAGGGDATQRNMLLSVLNENDAVLFKNQMSLICEIAFKARAHKCPSMGE